MLNKLTQERDCTLCSVFIRSRQVDLVTEDDKPTTNLGRAQLDTIDGLLVLAILLEGLDEQVGSRRTGEIEADSLHVRKFAESAEECHGFTGTRWSAEQQGLVLSKP